MQQTLVSAMMEESNGSQTTLPISTSDLQQVHVEGGGGSAVRWWLPSNSVVQRLKCDGFVQKIIQANLFGAQANHKWDIC